MIRIKDNFLPENIYDFQKQKLLESEFERIEVGGKDFHKIDPEPDFLRYVLEKVSEEFDSDIEHILSFFRLATKEIDTDWRIHSDLNILGKRPTHAGVLYFSEKGSEVFKLAVPENTELINPEINIYGTAFWKHKEYGSRLKPETTDEEYNGLLEVDANDVSRWELDSVVSAKKNRLLIYEASLFHSKYPNIAWSDENGNGRMVLVMFFNVIK